MWHVHHICWDLHYIYSIPINKKLEVFVPCSCHRNATRRRITTRKRLCGSVFIAYARIITRYARDRDRSMGVTKRALYCTLRLRRTYSTYAYIIINAHARTIRSLLRSEQNETARDKDWPAHAGETARHGTKTSYFLLMGTVHCICFQCIHVWWFKHMHVHVIILRMQFWYHDKT